MSANPDENDWFLEWLDEVVLSEGNNESAVARRAGVLPSVIHKWRHRASEPSLALAMKVIRAYRGNPQACLPNRASLEIRQVFEAVHSGLAGIPKLVDAALAGIEGIPGSSEASTSRQREGEPKAPTLRPGLDDRQR